MVVYRCCSRKKSLFKSRCSRELELYEINISFRDLNHAHFNRILYANLFLRTNCETYFLFFGYECCDYGRCEHYYDVHAG